MTEEKVVFLCNIAAALPETGRNDSNTLLKSYYLMRCQDESDYGLPDKHFSSKVRCPKCCIEWKSTDSKVRSIKLSKRQKQRLKSKKVTQSRKESVRRRHDLLYSNELVQVCSFCKNKIVNTVIKPQNKLSASKKTINNTIIPPKDNNIKSNNKVTNKMVSNNKSNMKQPAINVYTNALDVFSMNNKNNTLANTIKAQPKVINNNKKKKDRYAGLCQKAVLASAKLKEEKKKINSLSLFLKPSST